MDGESGTGGGGRQDMGDVIAVLIFLVAFGLFSALVHWFDQA